MKNKQASRRATKSTSLKQSIETTIEMHRGPHARADKVVSIRIAILTLECTAPIIHIDPRVDLWIAQRCDLDRVKVKIHD